MAVVGALVAFSATPLAQPVGTGTARVVRNATIAASCSQAHVAAAVAATTDGGTVFIPAGACTWDSGVVVPDDTGITIRGMGTPSADPAVIGADASCTATEITLTGATAFRATPTYGNGLTRISCMEIVYGSGASIGMSVLGTCTTSGCPSIRMDNVTFTNWSGHTNAGISYAITAIGNMFGVLDHNTITGTGNYLQLTSFAHASYMGVGVYGDNSWAQPEDYGTEKFLFFENNLFTKAGSTEANEGSAGALADQGGGRVVVRFNTFAAMDNLNFGMGWHGTESGGRPRGARAFEFYGNSFTCATGVTCGDVAGARSGTGMVWGNTADKTGAGINNVFSLSTYRTLQDIGDWGACDGSTPFDTNDGVTYYSGTIASVSGSNPYTITVSDSPGWTTNQWVSNGSPYSVHDVTIDNGSEITASGSNTLTVRAWTGVAYATGHTIQILRATACLDQAGGRGAGTLYSGNPASPASAAAQALVPVYMWANTFIGGTPSFNTTTGIGSGTARVIRNRDFYAESLNQAAQTSASAPFDGTTTVGAGHGVIARRPTTCTTGVSYWATDEGAWNTASGGQQGRLYICTAPNTWTLAYMPYTYPHPVIE